MDQFIKRRIYSEMNKLSLEDLRKQSEFGRLGHNYLATNIVYPFLFMGEKLIFKEAMPSVSLINMYYSVQDKCLVGGRDVFASKTSMIRREAEMLKCLAEDKDLAPNLFYFSETDSVLVKEFIPGLTFRDMNKLRSKVKKILLRNTLTDTVDAISDIHRNALFVGNPHIKNVIKRSTDGKVIFYDFDGKFDEGDLVLAQARDLVKLVYTTYTETRSLPDAMHIAEAMYHYSQEPSIQDSLDQDSSSSKVIGPSNTFLVKDKAAELVDRLEYGPRLWFATRVTKKAHEEIKDQLLRSFTY